MLFVASAAFGLSPPPDCPKAQIRQLTERGAEWSCGNGLLAYTSSTRPEHWHDGTGWKEPRLVWERIGPELVLQGVPGDLVYRATEHGLSIVTRDGQPVARIRYWTAAPTVSPDGVRLRFELQGLPCSLAATKGGPKLACEVEARRGRYSLSIPADGIWLAKDGAAVTAGVRLDRLFLIGADGAEYHNTVQPWRVHAGQLIAEIDDTDVPAPYVIDPLTGPNLPDTCADDATVGTITWSSPSNATGSDDSRATANMTASGESHYLKCTDFDFDGGVLDATKTIKGIVAEVECSCSGSSCGTKLRIEKAKLVRANGTISGSAAANRQNLTTWGTSDAQRALGGSLDTWGGDCDGSIAECLPSDVTDVDFGVAVAVKNTNASGSSLPTGRVDAIRMTVYYSPPTGRVFVTGFDTWGTEIPSTTEGWITNNASCTAANTPLDCCTGSGAGTCDLPTALAAAKRTGTGAATTNLAGLRIDTAADNASYACYALDTDLTDKGYLRAYANLTSSTLAPGQSALIMFLGQDDGADDGSDPDVGAYLRLERDAGGAYQVRVKYHGPQATDLDYGVYSLGLGSVCSNDGARQCTVDGDCTGGGTCTAAWQAFELGQVISGDRVAAPFLINGVVAEDFTSQLSDDSACSGGACDLAYVCLGTPSPGAVEGYAGFGALRLDFDDVVVDNLRTIGVGRVAALHPDANGATIDWSNTCAPATNAAWKCLQDFRTGPEDACLSTGNTVRERTGSAVTDLFQVDEIAGADMDTSDVIKGARYVNATCENNSNTGTLNLAWRQCESDAACTTPVDADGVAIAMTQNARRLIQEHRSENLSSDGVGAEEVWTESLVNTLQLGLDKVGSTGAMRSTAIVLYVDIKAPDPQPDWNLQDKLRCTGGTNKGAPCHVATQATDCPGAGGGTCAGDGRLTLLTGCDSITAGTLNSICSASGACQAPCSSDGACNGGTCVNGTCQMLCERNADCTCDVAATCNISNNWVNQLATRSTQFDTIINCGRNTMPLGWWSGAVAGILEQPRSMSPPCLLIKGAWGHCADQPTATCDGDAGCTGCDTPCQSGVCNHHLPDYVLDICGINEVLVPNVIPDNCSAQASGLFVPLPYITARTGEQACPMAAVGASGYEAERVTCTADSECTSAYGATSKCLGYCEGHTDPVWPCLPNSSKDNGCGTCAADTARQCYHQGVCNNSSVDRCDCSAGVGAECGGVQGSCPGGGTCFDWQELNGPWGDAFGDGCDVCEHRDCLTDVKYCSVPCSAANGGACTADSECSAPGGLGGICTGGVCTACGVGQSGNFTSEGVRRLFNKRLRSDAIRSTPDQMQQRLLATTATIEATGARHVVATYGATAALNPSAGILSDFAARKAAVELKTAVNVIDNFNRERHYDERLRGTPYCGWLVAFDCLHYGAIGAIRAAESAAATLNTMYPTCTANTAVLCGYCDAPCTSGDAAVSCESPDSSGGPGGCTGASNTRCQCSTNADCSSGCTCTDIDSSGTTDKRCVCEDVTDCPPGNLTTTRKRVASDDICALASAGTCSLEFAPPLCTKTKARCTTTADCEGAARGDVCAPDGVWMTCHNAGQCRASGIYAAVGCETASGITDKLCHYD